MEFGAWPTRAMNPRQSAAGGSSEGLAALSAGLARRLADKHANSNLVFSPLSIYTALALVAAGARGATLDEILHVLGARSRGELDEFVARAAGDALRDRSGSGGPRVASVCGVWTDRSCPLKPGFREAVVGGAYRADASTVDFRGDPDGSRCLINAWAARATHNLIDSVLGPGSVSELTRVVLGNAVYFKGKWDQPFDKSATAHRPFRRHGGAGAVSVPFMQDWERQFVTVHGGFKVLKLRYKMAEAPRSFDHRADVPFSPSSQPFIHTYRSQTRFSTPTQFSMCIFLPDADDGLRGLVDAIASRPGFLHDHLPRRKVDVGTFRLPRFKLCYHDTMVDVLSKLGLRLPFHPRNADLSDMTEADGSGLPLVLSDVIHKAVIEVNEEGTEAAAVTMVLMEPGCSMFPPQPPPRVDFVADHPFAYFIVEEETGAVVFAGHVVDPSRQ